MREIESDGGAGRREEVVDVGESSNRRAVCARPPLVEGTGLGLAPRPRPRGEVSAVLDLLVVVLEEVGVEEW